MHPLEVKLTPEWERRLSSFERRFSSSEQRVAEYILANKLRIRDMTIGSISEGAQVSQATVVRFCHRLGYEGLKGFKIAMAGDMKTEGVFAIPVCDGSDPVLILHDAIRRFIACLQDTVMIDNNKSFSRAVSAILNTKKIDLYGVGGSAPCVIFARHMLMKLGIRANECTSSNAQQLSATTLDKDDVVIAITNKGESAELRPAIPIARNRGAIVICITSRPLSSIAKQSDIVLKVASDTMTNSLSDPRVGIYAMIDALCHSIHNRKKSMRY